MRTGYIEHGTSASSFVGQEGVGFFQSCVIENALRFYAQTGMKVNRAYTPTAMLTTAQVILKRDKPFKRGQYLLAADELKAARMKSTVPVFYRTFEAWNAQVTERLKARAGVDPDDCSDEEERRAAFGYGDTPYSYVTRIMEKYELTEIEAMVEK